MSINLASYEHSLFAIEAWNAINSGCAKDNVFRNRKCDPVTPARYSDRWITWFVVLEACGPTTSTNPTITHDDDSV
jgi:hypothetical protein